MRGSQVNAEFPATNFPGHAYEGIKQKCLHFVPVQVSDGDNFTSYVVVQSVHRAGVDETVSYPESSLHNLLDLSLHLQ